MKVVIAGGTGFIGSVASSALVESGHEVVVLSRRRQAQVPTGVRVVEWPARLHAGGAGPTSNGWRDELKGGGVLINLAGASIAAGRWTRLRKAHILESRIRATRALVQATRAIPDDERPGLWINASAVGFYGPRGDEIVTEEAEAGQDFLSEVCMAWEAEARKAASLGARVVLLRLGLVLGSGGGALPRLLFPFRLYAGGPLGSGRQWWPWIHIADVVGLIRFVLEQGEVSGPLNAVAPEPVTNRTFALTIGRVVGRPAWMPAPAAALRLLLGEMADAMLLHGQRAIPAVAQQSGYHFRFPSLEPALRDVMQSGR